MPSEWEEGYRAGYGAGYADCLRYAGGPQPVAAAVRRSKISRQAAKPRKVSAYHRRLGKILKRLKKKHTLKNGNLRKGWSNSRIMKTAHKEAKK